MFENAVRTRNEGEKQVYLQDIQTMLAEKNARLRHIKCKVREATESRQILPGDQLLKAEQQADSCIKTLQAQIDLLETADDASWETLRFDVEMTWDELSKAIKKIVVKFPRG